VPFALSDVIGLAVLLLVGGVIALLGVSGFIAWTLTHPPRRTYASQVARGRPGLPTELMPSRAYDAWSFESAIHRRRPGKKASLPVWPIPGDAPDAPRIIITHGWSNSKHGALVRVTPLLEHASEIVLWDMVGAGEAPGTARLGALEHRDLLRLIEVLPDRRPTVLFGWSMGAGIVLRAASSVGEPPPAHIIAVIAEAPYRSPDEPARAVLAEYGLPHGFSLRIAGWIIGLLYGIGPRWRGYDRATIAKRVTAPLLVLHGTEDSICPFADGRAIAEAAPDGRLVPIPGGEHDDLWINPDFREQSAHAVQAFLDEIEADESHAKQRNTA
jgi:pimeloyl-ACP methyl ester carboxylesterase